MLDAALAHAQAGWRVFPLHPLDDGACTCSRETCGDAGKHPLPWNGTKAATRDAGRIRKWWAKYPTAGIGGVPAGCAVDVDDAAGLAKLEAELGPLPRTRAHRTGRASGEGRHLVFSTPTRTENLKHKFGLDLSIIGRGGFVVLPPSPHKTGAVYAVTDEAEVAPLPPRWAATFAPVATTRGVLPPWLPLSIPVGERHVLLTRLAGWWRGCGWDEAAILDGLRTVGLPRVENPAHDPVTDQELRALAKTAGKWTKGTRRPALRVRFSPIVATWTGRTAATDRRVFLDAILPAVKHAKNRHFTLSVRQAATMAGVKPETAGKALVRLRKVRRVIQLVGLHQPGMEEANAYLLRAREEVAVDGTVLGFPQGVAPTTVPSTATLSPAGKLLFSQCRGGLGRLGLAAGEVYGVLTTEERAPADLRGGMARKTFDDAIKRLEAHNLAVQGDAGWKRGPATVEAVAQARGVLDVGKKRKALYAWEREKYRERSAKRGRRFRVTLVEVEQERRAS